MDSMYYLAVIAILWILGGYMTYAALIVSRNAKPSRMMAAVCGVVWPFACLYAILTGGRA